MTQGLGSGNFVPLPPKLIPYVNLRHRISCGRHPRLFWMGAVQRVLGQSAKPLILGVVRYLAGHTAAIRDDCGADILQTR